MDNFSLDTNYSDQILKLEKFVTQNQSSIKNLNNQLNNVQQDLLQFKNNIEKTFNEIENELNNSQNFLTKLVSGANTKLIQEQIYYRQIDLTNEVQKINDTLGQISQEIDRIVNEFLKYFQQIIADYKSADGKLKLMSQANQTTSTVPPNYANLQLQQSIRQAIDALNAARQGIEQQKIFSELSKSLENLLQ